MENGQVSSNGGLVIGFTNVYYTLWYVSAPYKKFVSQYDFYWTVDVQYYQNLSHNLDEAIAKLKGQPYTIDLNQKGQNGSKYSYQTSGKLSSRPIEQFSFGKLEGQLITVSEDEWQLTRAMETEKNPRTRVIARRRLIELGLLVKHNHVTFENINENWNKRDENGNLLEESYIQRPINHKYISKKQFDFEQFKKTQNEMSGHFYNEKDKVTLNLKQIRQNSFDTQYGTCYVITYLSDDNRIFKYKGSSPLEISKEIFQTVAGTIAHGEYQGVNETRLLRMKIK